MITSAVVTREPGVEEAGDSADQPRVAGRSAATEDERSLA